jgi:putative methyltransferase (TIGR04325 family)
MRVLNSLSGQRGVFATFEEAWSAARRERSAGHEHPDAVTLHMKLSKALRPSDYAVLYWLSIACNGSFKVFDFGGNAGNLFYSYWPYLEKRGSIEWTVLDIPSVVEQGRRIADEENVRELSFTTSVREFSADQCLLISGALHYVEEPLSDFVRQFPDSPRYIIINRTPVHDDKAAFVTVQSTPTYAIPCIVRNSKQMVAEFGEHGYVLVDRWKATELSLAMPLFPDYSVPYYSGFFFRLESAKL